MLNIVNKLTDIYRSEIEETKNLILNSFENYKTCSTSLHDCLFLYLLIRHLKPTTILEIGTWVGSTLYSIILACEKNNKPYRIHTIDINNKLILDNKILHSVNVHKGWSYNVLQKMNVNFDFIFADGNINFSTAHLLLNKINENTTFATHDFVAPFDKGIQACFNMIRYTKIRYNKLVKPNYKCNWIYKSKSYESMHDNFSKDYVSKNNFDLDEYHNKEGINNCVAIICPNSFLTSLGLDVNLYEEAGNFIVPYCKQIKFNSSNYVLFDNKLFVLKKNMKEDVVYVSEFINKIPNVIRVYKYTC